MPKVNRTLRAMSIAICLSFASQPCHAQFNEVTAVPDELKTGFDSITAEHSQELLQVLAGPAFEGRGTGQVGYTRAAHWMAGKLAELGLDPIGDQGTYFQMVPIIRREPDLDACRITGPKGLSIEGKGNVGFDRMTDVPELTANLVVLNVSGDNPVLPEELVLRDKIVMYMADDAAARRIPRMLARKRPAASIRIVENEPTSRSIVSFPGGRRRSTSVSGTIIKSAVLQILEAMDGQADWLDASDEAGVQIHELEKSLTMNVPVRETQDGVPNVIGFMKGSDPEVNDEFVVIGAHLDHLGTRNGQVFPGADDNGSGSTAIYQIARALTLNPVKPRRSVMFIWFTGEEMGLQGSRYYVQNPLMSHDKMVGMLNIDMVGRNEETNAETAAENEGHLHLVGSKKGDTDLHQLVMKANQHIGFEFEFDEEDVFGRSDQINFYRQGVPVAFLFGGFHPDYHQPTDEIQEINYNKIAQAARLFYCCLFEVSEHGPFEMKDE